MGYGDDDDDDDDYGAGYAFGDDDDDNDFGGVNIPEGSSTVIETNTGLLAVEEVYRERSEDGTFRMYQGHSFVSLLSSPLTLLCLRCMYVYRY
jgi:hypothetical protein